MKRYLAMLLAGAMTLSVSGCSAADDFVEASTELDILMPENYISEKVISDFEEKHGCTVHISYMDDDAERYNVLMDGAEGYDLVMTDDGYLASLIEAEKILKIKHNELSNTSTINDSFWGSKSYCIPYLMEYVYVVYDSKTCPVEITKYGDLLDPALQGKIAVTGGERELLAMALATLGYAPNSVEESEIEKAYNWLVKLDENVAVYGDGKQELLDGTVVAAVTTDRVAAEVMAKNKAMKIASFTKDKVRVAVDLFVIPAAAEHADLSEKFMNDICDPSVMAKNLEEYPYSCPNEVAMKLVSEKYHKAAERQFENKPKVYFRKDISEGADAYEKYGEQVKELMK